MANDTTEHILNGVSDDACFVTAASSFCFPRQLLIKTRHAISRRHRICIKVCHKIFQRAVRALRRCADYGRIDCIFRLARRPLLAVGIQGIAR